MHAQYIYVVTIGDNQYAVPSEEKLTLEDAFDRALPEHEKTKRGMGVLCSINSGHYEEATYFLSEKQLRRLNKWKDQ